MMNKQIILSKSILIWPQTLSILTGEGVRQNDPPYASRPS